MTQLDRHVMSVQNRLALGRWIVGLAWAGLALAVIVWVNILVDRFLGIRLPRWDLWLYGGIAVAVVAAIIYAVVRRPRPDEAAVAIDQRLGLKEKFSTALYARRLREDPFASAAVRDAERAAGAVNLKGKFPLTFPRVAYATMLAALVVFLTNRYLAPQSLFAKPDDPIQPAVAEKQVEQTKAAVKQALTSVEQLPKSVAQDEKIEIAKKELADLVNKPIRDPAALQRSALEKQKELEEKIKESIRNNQQFTEAKNAEKAFRSINAPVDEKGLVADAHRAIAKADFTEALQQLNNAVNDFNKMNEEQKKKAAEQMQNLTKELQKMASDPQMQQKMQQQLQQMGANQEQAKQMQDAMQKAANGDKQAQQQMQQVAQQMMQQMNNGQGPTQQQQQQMQQMMQQMQAMANNQATAQQMAQAAQQMAQAMQQQANQQGQNPNQQQQQQQQMAQGQQQMQQQLQQMDAMLQDMKQMQAAQNAAAQGAQAAADGLNNGQGQSGGDGQQPGGGGQSEQQAAGNCEHGNAAGNCAVCNGNGNGAQGGGIGAGDRTFKEVAPYQVKQEIAPYQEDEKGKILASRHVKAGSIKGESKAELEAAADAAERDLTDEVDTERVSGQARRVLRDYFNSLPAEK